MKASSNIVDIAQLQEYLASNEQLRKALGMTTGLRPELVPFAQGEYNANYAFELPSADGVRAYLLRVNLGSQMHLANQIEYEFDTLHLLASTQRVPEAVYVDGSRSQLPYGVGVETRLPGRPLRYEEDLNEAAQILADIHAFALPDACHLLHPNHPVAAVVEECAQMFKVYRAWAKADPGLVARVDAMFDVAERIAEQDRQLAAPKHLHVVNTEVNSSNFLINPGARSYLVDWEKPIAGEVEQDLGHFLVPTTTYWKTDTRFTRGDVDGFVELYAHAVAGRFSLQGLRERLEHYLVVTCLRGITWCAMAYTEYLGGNRPAANADTFARIEEYLGEEFLSFVWDEYYA